MRCFFLFGIVALVILHNVISKEISHTDIEIDQALSSNIAERSISHTDIEIDQALSSNIAERSISHTDIEIDQALSSNIAERSAQNHREARQLKDIWNTIKNSAKNLWNSIKTIANNTNEKIKTWIQKATCRAEEIKLSFIDKLEQIREKSKKIIVQLVGTGKIVKECIEKDGADIEKILKKIIKSVSDCVSEGLEHASHLETSTYKISMNETKHFAAIESKMNACMEIPQTADECMHAVKKEVFADMENMESEVLKERERSRDSVDDLLDSITTCSVNGLLDASSVIAAEAATIVACVIKGQDMNGHVRNYLV